jgi:hypothetical protein
LHFNVLGPAPLRASVNRQNMGVIIIFLACLVPGWIVFVTARALHRERSGKKWWIALSVLAFAGLIAGIWAGFFTDYHVSPKLRFAGFPFPIAVFQLEDGSWVDYVHAGPIMLAIGVADVFVIAMCSALPVSAIFYARKLLSRRETRS